MRIDQDQAVEQDFGNVQFPTGFVEDITSPHGIAKIKEVNGKSEYLYDYENILSTTEDLYCDAKLGPPSILAQAIDASMKFLLGSKVSIGLLNSTAVAVNSCELTLSVSVVLSDVALSLTHHPTYLQSFLVNPLLNLVGSLGIQI